MFYKKSIVLTGVKNSNEKAVLSLELKDGSLYGNVRLYNFSGEVDGLLSLGIYVDKKVKKAGLNKVDSMQYNFVSELNEIPKKFSCAIVQFNGGIAKPLLFGSSEGRENSDNIFGAVISSLYEDSTYSNAKKVLDENNIDFCQSEKDEIENVIEENFDKDKNEILCQENCEKCKKCEYKTYFFAKKCENIEILEEEKKLNEKNVKNVNEEKNSFFTFYDKLKWQIDKIFKGNEKEEFLEQLLPNSKWVKVEYENDGDYYVFGLIYEEGKVKYVCYGVPGVFQKSPPKELTGYPVWFPLSEENIEGFGYWLTYQDAETGEPIRAIIE